MSKITGTKDLPALRESAKLKVREAAAKKVAELQLENVDMSNARAWWANFKTDLSNANTPSAIEQVKNDALAQIESV